MTIFRKKKSPGRFNPGRHQVPTNRCMVKTKYFEGEVYATLDEEKNVVCLRLIKNPNEGEWVKLGEKLKEFYRTGPHTSIRVLQLRDHFSLFRGSPFVM